MEQRIFENSKIVYKYDMKTKMLKIICEFINEKLYDNQNFYTDCIGSLVHENELESINTTYNYDVTFKDYYMTSG